MKWKLQVKDTQDAEIYATEVGSEAECDQIIADNQERWGVEAVITKTDISALAEAQAKILSRKEVREGCLEVVDKIATYNKDHVTPEQMGAIFSQPTFQGIVLALLTGAPTSAKTMLQTAGFAALGYPEELFNEIIADLTALE